MGLLLVVPRSLERYISYNLLLLALPEHLASRFKRIITNPSAFEYARLLANQRATYSCRLTVEATPTGVVIIVSRETAGDRFS